MIKVVTGNEAAAYGALLCRPEVVCAYPITPQTRLPEQLAEFKAQGLFKGKIVNAESEMGAISYVMGASAGGVRVFTATSSQGLAWMHETLHFISGSRLPVVMVDVNRPFGAPWNLTCEQTDSLSQRDTGWMQFYCESNQEVLDTVIQAYRVAETVSLPAMVCMDGVYLSFVSESVEIPEQDKVDAYLPPYIPGYRTPSRSFKLFEKYPPDEGSYKIGGWNFMQTLMRDRYEMQKLEAKCLPTFIQANKEYQAIFGRSYSPIEQYKTDGAEIVLVVSGSAVGTARYVVDGLRAEGQKVGLVKLKMFRPFPVAPVKEALGGRPKIVVIERDFSPGLGGIFCQEIKSALHGDAAGIYGFIAGLGGADITPSLIEKAVAFARANDPREEPMWLGLNKEEPYDQYDRDTIKIP